MSRIRQMAREDGWLQVIARARVSALHRLRDGFIARRLGATGLRIGRSPRILGLAHITIGQNFSAGDALWIHAVTGYGSEAYSPELLIGENVNLSDNVHVGCLKRVHIGDGCLVGSRVLISDHTHGVYEEAGGVAQSPPEVRPAGRMLYSAGDVVIGKNVWLGDGVCVLAGARIGDGAIVGANSVVRGEIPAAVMAVGAPARVVRQWDAKTGRWEKVSRS